MDSMPSIVGMVHEYQFSEPVPEELVELVEDMDGPMWPPEAKRTVAMQGLSGPLGTTRPVRAALTPDRRALRVEFDLGDVATP